MDQRVAFWESEENYFEDHRVPARPVFGRLEPQTKPRQAPHGLSDYLTFLRCRVMFLPNASGLANYLTTCVYWDFGQILPVALTAFFCCFSSPLVFPHAEDAVSFNRCILAFRILGKCHGGEINQCVFVLHVDMQEPSNNHYTSTHIRGISLCCGSSDNCRN